MPTHLVVANELQLLGGHGMQAHRDGHMREMIVSGCLNPMLLIGRTTGLLDAALGMGSGPGGGLVLLPQNRRRI